MPQQLQWVVFTWVAVQWAAMVGVGTARLVKMILSRREAKRAIKHVEEFLRRQD